MHITPIYPRPAENQIKLAKQHFCDVAEYIAPGMDALASFLIRAMINRGPTVAEAMWAIYEMLQEKVIDSVAPDERKSTVAPVSESWPAAGLDFAKGALHIDGGGSNWGLLYISIDHPRVAALKLTLQATSGRGPSNLRQSIPLSANTAKLFPSGIPENPDLVDLVVRLNSLKDSGRSMNDIARELMNGDTAKASSLLAQIRRLKRKGRINL